MIRRLLTRLGIIKRTPLSKEEKDFLNESLQDLSEGCEDLLTLSEMVRHTGERNIATKETRAGKEPPEMFEKWLGKWKETDIFVKADDEEALDSFAEWLSGKSKNYT